MSESNEDLIKFAENVIRPLIGDLRLSGRLTEGRSDALWARLDQEIEELKQQDTNRSKK